MNFAKVLIALFLIVQFAGVMVSIPRKARGDVTEQAVVSMVAAVLYGGLFALLVIA